MIEHTSLQIKNLLKKRELVIKYMDKIDLKYLDGNATFFFCVN